MGCNQKKFKLSNMMPNAWFYKLRDMNNNNNKQQQQQQQQHSSSSSLNINSQVQPLMITPSRASYYFPSNSPLHPKALDTPFPPPLIKTTTTTTTSDVILDLDLPPIITKPPPPPPPSSSSPPSPITKKQHKAANIHRLRLRANSPRLRLVQRSSCRPRRGRGRGLSETIVVVKNSSDPRKDFKESMMEMIVENEMKGARDLEDLLACYLSLNSSEYHGVIVRAFEDIWYDVTQLNVRRL